MGVFSLLLMHLKLSCCARACRNMESSGENSRSHNPAASHPAASHPAASHANSPNNMSNGQPNHNLPSNQLPHANGSSVSVVAHNVNGSSKLDVIPEIMLPACGLYGEKKCGCIHYVRRCFYVSPCCKKIYPCRICHDSFENHKINRFEVSEIVCIICRTKQPVQRNCSSCGVEFGRYFCPICRLFDDQDKKQFHCDQCGICRVDGRENFFHCPKCDICLYIDLRNSHKCVEKVTRSDCPVCLEDLHTSRESLSVLPCGHMTHRRCFRDLLKSGLYTCPLCCQSMVDMEATWRSLDLEIANNPMPEEYRDVQVTILCRDCHKISTTMNHIIGLKCHKCGSYNTCRESSAHAGAEDHSSASSHSLSSDDRHSETSAAASSSSLSSSSTDSHNGAAASGSGSSSHHHN